MMRRRNSQDLPTESPLPDAAWRRRFRSALLRWFRRHARQLPWRPSPGPYATWISEVMLQQTQVATVIPYYTRFLERFPNVQTLAAAEEQEVLRYWEGLGYYRRARQLHAAARRIGTHYGGQIPTSFERLCALPGIGRYTAGAILSIAHDQRHPIVEANTGRLFSRLLALDADLSSRDSQQQLWSFATALLPRRDCGDFNQALMELGSTICTPRAPQCGICPATLLCATRARGLQDRIPRRKRAPVYVDAHEAAVIVQRADGRVLLRQCPAGERWAGLWDFPRVAVTRSGEAHLEREVCDRVKTLTGVTITTPRRIAVLRHGVTRYRITLLCYQAACRRAGRTRDGIRWVTHADLESYPLSVTGRSISRLTEGG